MGKLQKVIVANIIGRNNNNNNRIHETSTVWKTPNQGKITRALGYQNFHYNSVYKWVQPLEISLEEFPSIKLTTLALVFIQQDECDNKKNRRYRTIELDLEYRKPPSIQ